MERARLLVADDDRDVCETFASILTEAGHEVVTAGRSTGELQTDITDSAAIRAMFEAARVAGVEVAYREFARRAARRRGDRTDQDGARSAGRELLCLGRGARHLE